MQNSPAAESPRRPAVREVIPADRDTSVRFYLHDDPHPFARWNYHPEYELHLILASSGRYVVGDVVGSYGPGQLMLVGPNLPHRWIADREAGQVIPDAHAVLHFSEEWVRACQAAMPELRGLNPLLRRSARGLEFHGPSAVRGADAVHRVREASEGMERVVRVLELLRTLATAPGEDTRLLVRDWVPFSDDEDASALVSHAIEYILEHLRTGVHLHDAARRAAMSDSAFSRYFKLASGQTFTDMSRQLRLTQACRLLESTKEPIAWIATEVGYANLSNFNRQFLRAYGVTPRQYRRTAATSSP
ncbi:hypothetical protein ASD65_08630 [Microbacterium sp. Root61]|nr:hypothetical protein ASD65_08630 [Microbacterium sp. Root61]